MKRARLLVPDAGPLISLGLADALDLLLRLRLPILVVDEVLHEITVGHDHVEIPRIRRFIEANPTAVTVARTFVGESAERRRREQPELRLRGMGEAALAELTARIDEFVEADEPILLLFEDSDVRRIRVVLGGRVHLLSTRALLVGMERATLIASADDVWRAIESAGRRPARALVDLPAPAGSSWLP